MTANELIAALEALPEEQKDLPLVQHCRNEDFADEFTSIVNAWPEVLQCCKYVNGCGTDVEGTVLHLELM